jgi:hypothetical protein
MAEKQSMERVLKLSDEKYKKDNARRIAKLSKEPKVGVYGNPLYKEFLGDVYSYSFQDYPVTIAFDGKTHMFPKTIAEDLQRRLDGAAQNNTYTEVSESIIV